MTLTDSLRMETLRELLSAASSVLSWKGLAILLAIINLKNLPFVWHLRLFHHFVWNIRWKPNYPYFPKGKPLVTHTGKPTHPVFVSYSVTSRTPISETDYNLHKSNSTYFSDLDVARTALVTRIYSPGAGLLSKELDAEFAAASRREGKKPPARKSLYVALGSVYCSFKREIKPFELYEMESKVIAWDQKWMYVLTFFVRPATRKGGPRTLFASAISKYVVKKGRLTIAPERVLRASGFLPPRPDGAASDASATLVESTDVSGAATPAGEGITATASGVDGSLVRQVLKMEDGDIPEKEKLEAEKKVNSDSWDAQEWTWEKIEEERLRGLKLVEGYANLDTSLIEEWER
ncbi:conserved hypothetical protein [Aspergillus terreus NIH2624]|uniref:Thioesterase atnL n=1 Tax=Aspergillus terreus (strain NIH 2624 / FGSC A1156) TaxID=341663 RepID=Q0D0W5_ASPTN|nr:uncharacterized protein ATEG_00419 [Aspergillus terreus NIH2624]EAU39065.1 conserved hypothetical protein [Aspergillus terreus NIH2624]